jgi:hypothetical protein
MNRRKFTQSIASVLGLSTLSVSSVIAKKMTLSKTEQFLIDNKKITTQEGLLLTLKKHVFATTRKDEKQFILTYDVKNSTVKDEKIYDVTSQTGEVHQIFMSAINDHQLQAVFNWRLNA